MLRILVPRKVSNKHVEADKPESPRPRSREPSQKRRSIISVPLHIESNHQTSQSRSNKRSSLAGRKTDPFYADWDIPHLTKTPWEADRHKKQTSWRRSKLEYEFPAHFFQKLPREVYNCIVEQLEQIHLRQEQPCPSCYLRDLFNLSLVSRAWDKATTSPMYRKITLVANEEHHSLPKLKTRGTSRLKLLRRTLRERAVIARSVRELHMPDFQLLYENATIEREEIVNMVASLVMACPFLERLTGFNISYTHAFDRLSHALSTRPNLRERVWLLSENDVELYDEDENAGYYLAACDPTERFLELNAKHPLLTTCVLYQEQHHTTTSLNFRSIVGTLRQLPALRHLCISGLSASSFTNLGLNALPTNLESLRLENLPGINDNGLQRFANSELAKSITCLKLVDLDLTNLITISNIFSSRFPNLLKFSIVQRKAPGLASRVSVPDFYAALLEHLHWEFRSDAGPLPALSSSSDTSLDQADSGTFPFTNSEPICCLATSVLATSIQEGGFPSLRRIRIPHDPQGVIQALCKPLATALLPSDAAQVTANKLSNANELTAMLDRQFTALAKPYNLTHETPLSPRADSAIESLTSSMDVSVPAVLTPSRSRVAAQSRIFAARKDTHMMVRVYDPNGELEASKGIKGFLGDVSSNITYDLTPDRGRTLGGDSLEGNVWMTRVEDIVGEPEGNTARLHERSHGMCSHVVGGRVGKQTVEVKELF